MVAASPACLTRAAVEQCRRAKSVQALDTDEWQCVDDVGDSAPIPPLRPDRVRPAEL